MLKANRLWLLKPQRTKHLPCHLFENPTGGFSGKKNVICKLSQRKRLVEILFSKKTVK